MIVGFWGVNPLESVYDESAEQVLRSISTKVNRNQQKIEIELFGGRVRTG